MIVDWEQEFVATVSSDDGTVSGRLKFDVQTVEWSIRNQTLLGDQTDVLTETIDPDPERREALLQERMEFAGHTQAALNALVAEWEGRVRMFAEGSREMALLGAQVKLRKWRRRV